MTAISTSTAATLAADQQAVPVDLAAAFLGLRDSNALIGRQSFERGGVG
jgi:hypothetical protein